MAFLRNKRGKNAPVTTPKILFVYHAQNRTCRPGRRPRPAHRPLAPVIEYLLAQGNTPAGWRWDAFAFDQGGEGHYTFTGPIDAAQLRERFAFPASIQVYDDGSIKDSLNRVDIGQESPSLRFRFEQPQ